MDVVVGVGRSRRGRGGHVHVERSLRGDGPLVACDVHRRDVPDVAAVRQKIGRGQAGLGARGGGGRSVEAHGVGGEAGEPVVQRLSPADLGGAGRQPGSVDRRLLDRLVRREAIDLEGHNVVGGAAVAQAVHRPGRPAVGAVSERFELGQLVEEGRAGVDLGLAIDPGVVVRDPRGFIGRLLPGQGGPGPDPRVRVGRQHRELRRRRGIGADRDAGVGGGAGGGVAVALGVPAPRAEREVAVDGHGPGDRPVARARVEGRVGQGVGDRLIEHLHAHHAGPGRPVVRRAEHRHAAGAVELVRRGLRDRDIRGLDVHDDVDGPGRRLGHRVGAVDRLDEPGVGAIGQGGGRLPAQLGRQRLGGLGEGRFVVPAEPDLVGLHAGPQVRGGLPAELRPRRVVLRAVRRRAQREIDRGLRVDDEAAVVRGGALPAHFVLSDHVEAVLAVVHRSARLRAVLVGLVGRARAAVGVLGGAVHPVHEHEVVRYVRSCVRRDLPVELGRRGRHDVRLGRQRHREGIGRREVGQDHPLVGLVGVPEQVVGDHLPGVVLLDQLGGRGERVLHGLRGQVPLDDRTVDDQGEAVDAGALVGDVGPLKGRHRLVGGHPVRREQQVEAGAALDGDVVPAGRAVEHVVVVRRELQPAIVGRGEVAVAAHVLGLVDVPVDQAEHAAEREGRVVARGHNPVREGLLPFGAHAAALACPERVAGGVVGEAELSRRPHPNLLTGEHIHPRVQGRGGDVVGPQPQGHGLGDARARAVDAEPAQGAAHGRFGPVLQRVVGPHRPVVGSVVEGAQRRRQRRGATAEGAPVEVDLIRRGVHPRPAVGSGVAGRAPGGVHLPAVADPTVAVHRELAQQGEAHRPFGVDVEGAEVGVGGVAEGVRRRDPPGVGAVGEAVRSREAVGRGVAGVEGEIGAARGDDAQRVGRDSGREVARRLP